MYRRRALLRALYGSALGSAGLSLLPACDVRRDDATANPSMGASTRRGYKPLVPSTPAPIDPRARLDRICLGSCNKHDRPQTHFDVIAGLDPDLWIWMGDIVYGDTQDEAELRHKYATLLGAAPYRRFSAQVPVVGTWDDHDFGSNDAGREFPARQMSQRALLDFLGEPPDSPRRSRAGVYTSHDLGPVPDQVRVILLDGRYHRDAPGPAGDPLGAEQWAWLESTLRGSTATVNLIVNGYQIIPEDHPYESWARFPGARRRLFEIIAASQARGVVLCSGDRHHAELSRLDDGPVAYPVYELTTSGLTHAFRSSEEPNRHRVGELYTGQNFGRFDLDWEARVLTVAVHDIGGDEVWSHRVPFAEIGEAHYTPASSYDDE